jgi:hypothetical protein
MKIRATNPDTYSGRGYHDAVLLMSFCKVFVLGAAASPIQTLHTTPPEVSPRLSHAPALRQVWPTSAEASSNMIGGLPTHQGLAVHPRALLQAGRPRTPRHLSYLQLIWQQHPNVASLHCHSYKRSEPCTVCPKWPVRYFRYY